MNIRRVQSALVISFGLISCGVAFCAEPIVWVVPSTLVRVGPKDHPGFGTKANLSGGRGEYVDFQVAVHAPEGGLTNLNFSISKLKGSACAEIASQNLVRYRESYITLAAGEHSSLDGEVSGLPDVGVMVDSYRQPARVVRKPLVFSLKLYLLTGAPFCGTIPLFPPDDRKVS
jgi:hypothetical protein